MKRIKGIILILMGILAISIVWILTQTVSQSNFSFSFNFGSRSTQLTQEATFNIADFDALDISGVETDITFIVGTTDEIIVRYYSSEENDRLVVSENNRTLRIEGSTDSWIFNFLNFRGSLIEVVVPNHDFTSINLKSVSGDITAPYLSAQSMNIKSTSGNINITNIMSKSTTLETVSGDIFVDVSEASLSAKTVSGTIDMSYHTGSVDLSTTSGDIDIEAFLMKDSSQLKSVSGNISIQFNADSTPFILDSSTISGNTRNNFLPKTNVNPLRLQIKTTSGDIDLS